MRKVPLARASALALAAAVAFCGAAMLLPATGYAQSPVVASTLPDVEVNDASPRFLPLPEHPGGQVADGGRLGLMGNTGLMEAPFNQTSYTAGLIEDQQASRLVDLLESDPSVRASAASANFQEYLSIRGFMVGSQDAAINGMYGLSPYLRPPLEMAERVEVLKGPSAVLNGMSPYGSTGGSINIVPKRATTVPIKKTTAGYQSKSQASFHADVGHRFGADDGFGARMNAVYRNGGTAIDFNDQEGALLTLAVDYQGERLRASLDLLHQHQHMDNFVRQFAVDPSVVEVPAPPATGLNYPGYGRLTSSDSMAAVRVEYDVTEQLTLHGALGRRVHETDVVGAPMLQLMPGGLYLSPPGWQILQIGTTTYEVGAGFGFTTGLFKHKAAFVASRLEDDQDTFLLAPLGGMLRLHDLYASVLQPLPATAGIAPDVGNYLDTALTSYALVDTIFLLEDRLQGTFGARHQTVEIQTYDITSHLPEGNRYNDSAITPLLGIVAKPASLLSIYANYSEDLSRGPSALPPAVTIATTLPPIRTRQVEVGIKRRWDEFTVTGSLFQIERPSATVDGNVLSQNGKQRNRGLELGAFGEAARDIRLLGGLTWMHGELTRTPGGRHDGKDAIGVPRVQASVGVDRKNVGTAGFGIGMRIVHTGSQYIDQANRLKLPSSTRVDAGASYTSAASGQPLTLRLNVENLFDRSYWLSSNAFANNDAGGGYLSLSTGRTLMLSATLDFRDARSPP